MTEHNLLVTYAKAALIAFDDVLSCGQDIPNVMCVIGDTDYCGKMVTGVEDCVVVSAVLVLNLENIKILADNDNIDIEQAALETIYHEWIHFIHSISYPDDMDKRMTHSSELWDDMIVIGMSNGFIHREAI